MTKSEEKDAASKDIPNPISENTPHNAEGEKKDNVDSPPASGRSGRKKLNTVESEKIDRSAVADAEKNRDEDTAHVDIGLVSVPPEEFDWDAYETTKFSGGYSRNERSEMKNEYDATTISITEGSVVEGSVVGISDRDVILNIGFKSDGLVPLSEFKDLPDLKTGDIVDLFVEEREDSTGQLILSRRKAKLVKSWKNIQDTFDNNLVIEGFVKRRTKGGLIVDIYDVEAFLPGSQIDVKPIRDFDIYVDKSIEVKIVKINHTNDNVVVSHKVLIEKDIEEQKLLIINNLEKGQVLEGVIKNMTDFGVFIDLGGVDGLLHITDISWERINHPSDLLKLDQKVKVVVLDFDEGKKRISLGIKQLTAHPWDSLSEEIDVGTKVKGKIVNVADYGAFLEIKPGIEGLIHVSEMSRSQHIRNIQDLVKVGDEVEAVVLTIDREEKRMSLGMKQLKEDPWTRSDVLDKYAVGSTHMGVVKNLTNFGLFVELEEGIDGLVHVSDLSWIKKIKHPSHFVKIDEQLEVKVMEIDVDNHRLTLSHKHLEENPWDTFETIFQRGTVHPCVVIHKGEKGLLLELPYGVEGYCSIRNMVKQDGSELEIGGKADFKILDISKEEKRILLSHRAVWSGEEIHEPNRRKNREYFDKDEVIRKINKSGEKTTFDEIESLNTLREKMRRKEESDSSEDADKS